MPSTEKHIIALIDLGQFLADRRKQMGRTQQDLAMHLGFSIEAVKAVENGEQDYSFTILLAFCEALEIKPFFVPLEHVDEFNSLQFNT